MHASSLTSKIAGAAMFAATGLVYPATAAEAFTPKECSAITVTTTDVMKALGPETLSKEFRRSLVNFIMPDHKVSTCNGPKEIATPTGPDIDALNTIASQLLAVNIDLGKAGLRSVGPSKVTPAQPK